MEIKLNNQVKVFEHQCTVQQMLDQIRPEKQKGIAVAINNSIVPKTNWEKQFINPNDDVLIITATQGG